MTYPQRNFSITPILLTAVVVITALAIVCNLHADVKHGEAATIAGSICHQQPEIRFYNPALNRFMDVCRVDGKWALWIFRQNPDGSQDNITSFVKEKMTRVEQVIKYAHNAGYEPVEGMGVK